MKNKMVYIAMPYTHPDPVDNTRKAISAAEQVKEAGFIPCVPHLSLLWHLVSPHPVEFWYEYDLVILARCDCLLRLGRESAGADKEVEFARHNNIPVFFAIEELKEFYNGQNAANLT